MLRVFLIMSVSLGCAGLAYGQDAEEAVMASKNEWVRRPIRQLYKSDGYSNKQNAKAEIGEILFTSSTDEPGIYFSCLAGKFRVGVVLEGRDVQKTFAYRRLSGISTQGKHFASDKSLSYVDASFDDGKKKSLGRWYFFKDNKAVMSRGRKPAAQLYNAIVRKQSITVKAKKFPAATLSIPKIDSTFADFGADCGVGRKSRRLE